MNNNNNYSPSKAVVMSSAYEGPIPQASELMRYKEVDESFPDRIISMAEKEQDARHNIELDKLTLLKSNQRYDFIETLIGQVFALSISLFTISVGAWLTIRGFELVGGIIGTSGVAGIASVFIIGRSESRKDKEDKS